MKRLNVAELTDREVEFMLKTGAELKQELRQAREEFGLYGRYESRQRISELEGEIIRRAKHGLYN